MGRMISLVYDVFIGLAIVAVILISVALIRKPSYEVDTAERRQEVYRNDSLVVYKVWKYEKKDLGYRTVKIKPRQRSTLEENRD